MSPEQAALAVCALAAFSTLSAGSLAGYVVVFTKTTHGAPLLTGVLSFGGILSLALGVAILRALPAVASQLV